MQFDGLILAERYGIRPARYFCTLAAARHWLRGEVRSHGLEYLSKHYRMAGKSGVLDKTKGVVTIPDELWPELEEYAGSDIRKALVFYLKLAPHIPESERRAHGHHLPDVLRPGIRSRPAADP